jgi:hypothetical protein
VCVAQQALAECRLRKKNKVFLELDQYISVQPAQVLALAAIGEGGHPATLGNTKRRRGPEAKTQATDMTNYTVLPAKAANTIE